MIVKIIPAKKETGSFRGLADYISGRTKGEKIADLWIENCDAGTDIDDLDLAIKEVELTQHQNEKQNRKEYHMVVSFPEGETPPKDTLKTIVGELCEGLGFEDHQRVVAVHKDTDHMHVHVGISKVHPQTYKINTPFKDHFVLQNVRLRLQRDLGLKLIPGDEHRVIVDKRERTIPFGTYIEQNGQLIRKAIDTAKNWTDLHHKMGACGVQIAKSGNGMAITEPGSSELIKLSKLGREYSAAKLQDSLGTFAKPVNRDFSKNHQARDMEANTWETSFASYVESKKEDIKQARDKSGNWDEFQEAIAEYGLGVKKRANGMVFTNLAGEEHAKVSTADRSFSYQNFKKEYGEMQEGMGNQNPQTNEDMGSQNSQTNEDMGSQHSQTNEDMGSQNSQTNDGNSSKAKRKARAIPNGQYTPKTKPTTFYQRQPITKHPGQWPLWKKWGKIRKAKQEGDKGVIEQYTGVNSWQAYLLFMTTGGDPMAMAIIAAHTKFIDTIIPTIKIKSRKQGNLFGREDR